MDGLLIGDVASAERCHLVEDGESVSHSAVSLLCYDIEGCILYGYSFFLSHPLQVRNGIVHGHALEVIYLASAQDCWQNLVLLRCGEDEDGMFGRFFERLEEGIKCSSREHVYLVNDEDLVFAYLWRYHDLVYELSYVVHRVVGCRVEFVDIE